MFEKEAEARVRDYIIKSRDCLMQPCKTLEDCKVQELEFDEVVKLVKEGAEFGYKLAHEEIDCLNKHWRSEEERKANEWHYVKDGLPTKDGRYLICNIFSNNYVATNIAEFNSSNGIFSCIDNSTIYAWKEIVLPELKEIE